MANYDSQTLVDSIPANQRETIQNRIKLFQINFPEIWNTLLEKQRFCPADVSLPNFCCKSPDKEKCTTCWKNALKFDPNIGVSISKSGRFLCSKCRTYLFCIGETDDQTPGQSASEKKYIWECPICSKKYYLELDKENVPNGYQVLGEEVNINTPFSQMPKEEENPPEDDSDA